MISGDVNECKTCLKKEVKTQAMYHSTLMTRWIKTQQCYNRTFEAHHSSTMSSSDIQKFSQQSICIRENCQSKCHVRLKLKII